MIWKSSITHTRRLSCSLEPDIDYDVSKSFHGAFCQNTLLSNAITQFSITDDTSATYMNGIKFIDEFFFGSKSKTLRHKVGMSSTDLKSNLTKPPNPVRIFTQQNTL